MASQLMGDAAFALISTSTPQPIQEAGAQSNPTAANLCSCIIGRAAEDTDPDGTHSFSPCPPKLPTRLGDII